MFDKFESRYIIEGDLVAATALHIGAAEDAFRPGGCKNPFFRNAKGLPLIPGSSLKGAMRSFLEQYLSSESGQKRYFGEDQPQKTICNEQNPCVDLKDSELKQLLKKKEKESQKELSDYLFGVKGEKEGKLCIICRLFGSPCSAAKFNIRDAGVKEETFQREFEIRSGVAIDRNLGVSVDGKKFETEVVPEGTIFSFRAILENGDDMEWELIKDLFQAMKVGLIAIGGMKSRGLGEIRLENIRYQKIDGKNIVDYLTGKKIEDIVL